ncbi:MAG: prolipoprotein diacylglyceryl transferase family protein [Acidobacteriaceae bacterium]
MHPLLFHFGHIAVPTYGVLTAAALLAALAMLVQQAKRLDLRADKAWNLGLIAILAALFGARLLLVAAHLRAFRAHPFWVLGLANISGTWIALGGVAIGLAAAVLYALAEGLPLLRTADAAAPAVALAFAINRIGAFCGGLAWGTPTTLPWGVSYRSVVAYLWYRTPLGVTLHPVQLYDAAASLAIFALLVGLPHRRDGETAGAWLFLYGVCRFFVEFYRGDPRERVFGGALSLVQALAIVAVILGGALWLRREPQAATPGEMPAPSS